jgi:iron complex outermembrane receptor protein
MNTKSLAVFAVPFITTLAHAADTDSETMETITVTASPFNEDEYHMAQPATVLFGEELKRKLYPTIGETLAREPGISSTYFGPGASRPIIRGLGASRVRILENGMGSMDVSNLSPDHAVSIEPLAATQVEVIKGPATLLYGSGASGGVVNVVTNRIASTLPEKVTGAVDSRFDYATNEQAGAFTIDAPFVGMFNLHLDGSVRATDDYDIPGFGNIDPEPGDEEGTLNFSSTETNNLTGGLSYIGGWGYLGFDVGHLASNYDIPGEGAQIDLKQLRYDVKGEITRAFLPGIERIKVQVGHTDYEHQEFEPSGEVGTTFLNDEFEGRMEMLHDPIGIWSGAVGLQIQHRDFEAVGEEALTPPLTSDAAGLFVYEHADIGDWHVEMGGRVEHQKLQTNDGSAPGVEHLVYSLSGGAIWTFTPGYSTGVSLTRAQRAPSLEELYNDGPHEATASFERGDIDLTEETSNNVDLSFRRIEGNWTWRVNLFANYIEDYIYETEVDQDGDGVADLVDEEGNLVPAGTDEALLLVDFVQGDAIFYGAEAETTIGLWKGSFGAVDGRMSADFVRAMLTDGDDLPRIPPFRLGAGLDYRYDRWLANVDLLHVFDQEDTAALETETNGYTLLEAGVSYTYATRPADYTVSLRGTNLLDEEVRLHTSFLKNVSPLPGRSVMASLRVAF